MGHKPEKWLWRWAHPSFPGQRQVRWGGGAWMGATAATVNIGSLRQRRRELRRRRLRSPFPFPSTPLFSSGNCLDSGAKARTGPGVFLYLKCTFLCGVYSALLFRLTCRTQGAKIILFCFHPTFLSLSRCSPSASFAALPHTRSQLGFRSDAIGKWGGKGEKEGKALLRCRKDGGRRSL